MGQNADQTLMDVTNSLKELAKIPVPPNLQKDFETFKTSTATLQSFLEKAADCDD